MEGEEPAVQPTALIFEYAYADTDACLADAFDAASLHLGKRIDSANNYPAHPLVHDEVAAGRRLAEVGTRFQRHIDGGCNEQRLVLRSHRGKGIHFGMSLTATHVIAFAQDAPLVAHDDTSHHRIGPRQVSSVAGQLQAASHVEFVGR